MNDRVEVWVQSVSKIGPVGPGAGERERGAAGRSSWGVGRGLARSRPQRWPCKEPPPHTGRSGLLAPRSPCWSWFQGSRRASVSELGRAISRAPNSAPGSNSGTQRSGSPDLSQMFERPPLRICWRPWPPQGAVELDLFSRIQGMRVCSAGAGEAARLWLAAGSARRDLGVFQMLARDSAGRASGALRPTSVDGGWSLHTSRGRLSDVRG